MTFNTSLKRTLIYLSLFLVCMGVSIRFQYREMKNVALTTVFFDKWVFSPRSSTVLKKMAMGYDIVVADFLWLRTIQSFGGRGMSQRDWRPVYYQFDTLTDIDPTMEHAYTFGNMVIGDEGRQQKEGLALIDKGMRNMPYRYRVPFEGMYISNWTLKDKTKARWYGRVAEKALNAPDWIGRMVAYLDIEDGEYYVGVDRYLGSVLEGLDTDQDHVINISIIRMADAIDSWNKSHFNKALTEYRDKHSADPTDIKQLATTDELTKKYETVEVAKLLALVDAARKKMGKSGINASIFEGDVCKPTAEDFTWADQAVLELVLPKDGKITSIQNDIYKAALLQSSGTPKSPFATPYVWNPMFAEKRAGGEPFQQPLVTESLRKEALTNFVKEVRQQIANFQEREGRLPLDLNEVFDCEFLTPEPYGGKWIYTPANGEFKSSAQSDI